MAKRRAKKKPEPEWPMVLETYHKPTPYSCSTSIYICGEPSAFNGIVSVVRYRVTIEPIDEPEEQAARVTKLWNECGNHHLWGPIKAEAARLGVELPDRTFGKDAKHGRY